MTGTKVKKKSKSTMVKSRVNSKVKVSTVASTAAASTTSSSAGEGEGVTLIVGLDLFYDRWETGNSGLASICGDIVTSDCHWRLCWGATAKLDFLGALPPEVSVWFFSPYNLEETELLLAGLKKTFPEASLPPLLMAGAKGNKESERYIKNIRSPLSSRLDRRLKDELTSRGLPLHRVLLVDTRFFGSLQPSRIPNHDGHISFLASHIARLSQIKGDLRRCDLEIYRDDYDERRRGEHWEVAKTLSYPPGAAAGSKDQSLLVLDLDGTLAFTDQVPLSKEGKESYAKMMSLFGYPTTGEELGDQERPCDYFFGKDKDYGGWKRPGLEVFMRAAHASFDKVCVYSAATGDYVLSVLEQSLAEELRPDFILSREHLLEAGINRSGVKSMVVLQHLGYDPKKVVIIENEPKVYRFARKNLVTVSDYYGSADDTVLRRLAKLLFRLSRLADVRQADFQRTFSRTGRSK